MAVALAPRGPRQSRIQHLRSLPADVQAELVAQLHTGDAEEILRSWTWTARPGQEEPPGDWRWWLLLTGRGYGKSRTGSEWTCDRAEQFAAHDARHLLGLMNATYTEVRQIQIGGESGIASVAARRGHRLEIGKTALEGRLRVWDEGWKDTLLEIHTAAEPEKARGRNFHSLWPDEAAKWPHKTDAEGGTAFTNADLGLRAKCPRGLQPRGVVTTTPKPIPLVKDLVAGAYGRTKLTTGSLHENADNLDESFVEAVEFRYGGTRLGRQEIDGELLEDVEGALWTSQRLADSRVAAAGVPDLAKIVVAIDPAGGDGAENDETGIVVAGVARVGDHPHLFVLEDLSGHWAPEEWAQRAVEAYWRYEADRIVGEVNFGGDMVRSTVKMTDNRARFEVVRATRGKVRRAEPVAVLWTPHEKDGRVIRPVRGHIVDTLPELETQMTQWVPPPKVAGFSPDRMDAMVWAASYLIPDLGRAEAAISSPTGKHLGDTTSAKRGQTGQAGLTRRLTPEP